MQNLLITPYSRVDMNADGVVRTTQDVEPILKQNHMDRGQHNSRAEGRHVARVPITIRDKWVREWKEKHSDKFEWKTYLVMKLNSPEWKYLKTTEGTI